MAYSSTSKRTSSASKTIVDMLVDVGFSRDKATNLYNKYNRQGRLEVLTEYIEAKKASQKKEA